MCTPIYTYINTLTSTYINVKQLKHLILNITPLVQLELNTPNTTCLHTVLPLIFDHSPPWDVLSSQQTGLIKISLLVSTVPGFGGQLAAQFDAGQESR